MCEKAIVGQEVKHNNSRNQGLEDDSYSIFNLHVSSIGTGVAILIILILVYKIIKHSNVQSWTNILHCLFPCCRLTNTPPREQQRDTYNTNNIPLNTLHCRTSGRQDGNHTSVCKVVKEPSVFASLGRDYVAKWTTRVSSLTGEEVT